MPNVIVSKEEEKVGSEALSVPDDEGKKVIKCISCLKEKEGYINELCKECSDKMDNHILKTRKQFKIVQPNNSLSLSTDYSNQDIEIEARESYQLKQSLGI